MAGNASGQLVQMLSLLVLTTLYSVAEFGRLGNVQAIASVTVVILTLQLQHIIPISDSSKIAKTKAANVIQIVLTLFLLFSITSLLLEIDYFIAFSYALVLAFTATLNNLLIFNSNFSFLSKTYIVRALLIVFCQFSFFYLKINNGLLLAVILGEFLSLLYILTFNKFWFLFKIDPNLKGLITLVKEWKTFTLYGTIQEALSVLVYSLPIIFYVNKFGDAIGGQFSIAFKLTFAPTILLSSSLAQVLTHKFGKENDFSFLKNIIWFDKKILVLVPIIIIISFLISNYGITFMNGKWDIAIHLIPYLLLNSVFFLFANPFRLALRVLKRNIDILKVEVLTLSVLGILFLIKDYSVITFTIIITIVSLLQNILLVFSYFRYNKLRNNI